MRKRNVLGVAVSATDYDEVTDQIASAAQERRPLTVTALAVHGVMTGVLDPQHQARLNALDVVLPDGQPVRWALNLLFGERLKERVCGPELTLRVCAKCEADGIPVAFYGSQKVVLDDLRDNLKRSFPNLQIVAMIPSLFRRVTEDEQVLIAERITNSGAALVFIGLGCPRQEVWLFENRHKLQMPMLAVGAAFDFHARRLAIAPRWMQEKGLEWCYRLVQEPRRLWRRYLLLNPIYLMLLLAQMMRLHRPRDASERVSISFEG